MKKFQDIDFRPMANLKAMLEKTFGEDFRISCGRENEGRYNFVSIETFRKHCITLNIYDPFVGEIEENYSLKASLVSNKWYPVQFLLDVKLLDEAQFISCLAEILKSNPVMPDDVSDKNTKDPKYWLEDHMKTLELSNYVELGTSLHSYN